MSLFKTEIAQNKLTTSVSEMHLNKKFLLERFIETVAISSKYWTLNQFSKVTSFLFIIIVLNIFTSKYIGKWLVKQNG